MTKNMNNDRRKEIRSVISEIEKSMDVIENILEDEDVYRDLIPENLIESKRYEDSEEASNNLQFALDSLEDVIDNLQEIVD